MHLAIDLGTSSLKMLTARSDGTVSGGYEESFEIDHPYPGWAEADPEEWWAAVQRGLWAIGGVWESVVVTGQMHGTVLVGAIGEPVRRAVLWPDTRAGDRSSVWVALPAVDRARLGGPFSPGMTGPVLAWLAENEPEVLDRAEWALLPKDFIVGRLTSRYGTTDRSDASGTLLWDVADERWSARLPDAAGFAPDLLPAVLPSSAAVGEFRHWSVLAGGGDTAASLLAVERAVGGWQPGDRVVNVGSGAQVIDPLAAAPQGGDEPAWHTYADCGNGHYAMVAVLNAGLAETWAREQAGLDWWAYRELAARTPPGANGAVFVPALASERGAMRPPDGGSEAPRWIDADELAARARAVAESQAFLIRRADGLLGPASGRVFAVGGGTRDERVCRLLANVLGRDVVRLDVRSAAAFGALCLSAGPDFPVHAPSVPYPTGPSAALDDAYERWLSACYG